LGWAGYVIERYKKQNWTIESGIRFDYRSYSVDNPEGNNQELVHYDFDYSNMSGTLGVKHQLRHNWQWGATLANAWRAPQASELFSAGLHHGAARIEIGNKNLLPERSFSLNLETKYTFQEKLTVDVAVYSQLIDHFIFLQPGPDLLTIRGYFKTFNYQQTNAWLNGTDVMVHYQWNSYLETSLKTSLLRARNRTANDWLILMPADRISFNARYTRDISLHLRECFIGMEPRYVWQQTRIPANFDSIDYPRPPQPYFLLDAAAGARLIVGKQSIYMSLTVTNLLNEAYRDYLDVFRYFLNQQGTNAILRARLPIDFSKN
jgi:iron complex outermembrane receptor protein